VWKRLCLNVKICTHSYERYRCQHHSKFFVRSFLFVKCENHIFCGTPTPLSLWMHAKRGCPSCLLAPYTVNLNCSYYVKEVDTSAYSQFVDIFVLCFNYVVMKQFILLHFRRSHLLLCSHSSLCCSPGYCSLEIVSCNVCLLS